MKKLILVLIFVLSYGFDYNKVYSIDEFPDFKHLNIKSSYINRILRMKKYPLNETQKEELIYLYEKEKMIRDILIMISHKYDYQFIPYIASLTQIHLSILNKFFNKYNIAIPNSTDLVGKFNNPDIQKEYYSLLHKSLQNKKVAAKLSVKFMTDLVNLYRKDIHNMPRDIKRMLLKLNSFNKKVLYRFKKGLRNIEIGLPVE